MVPARRLVRIAAFALIGAGVVLVGVVAASSVLFSQTFPSVPSAPPGSLTASCSTLQAWNEQVPAEGGPILFNCTQEAGAFVVSDAPATATPTFALPANATDLYVVPAYPTYTGPGTGCAAYTEALMLTSGTPATFDSSGNWDYCVDATGSLPGFSVSWAS